MHKSATPDKSITLVAKDVAYQVAAGYTQVMARKDLQVCRPHNLKVSPLAVVPQQNQRRHIILDRLFGVFWGQKRPPIHEPIIQALVNDITICLAPDASVKEPGKVLPQMLIFMATVPVEEHIHFTKNGPG